MQTASRGDSGSAVLFVEILNKCEPSRFEGLASRAHACRAPRRYLYFFDKGCEAVTPEVLCGLLQLIGNELSGDGAKSGDVDAFHKATLQHIRAQQAKEGELAARYAAVAV